MKKKTIIFIQNIDFPEQGAIDIFYYAKELSKYDDLNLKIIISKINDDISNKNLEIIELGKVNYLSFIIKSFFILKKLKKQQSIDYVYFFAQHPFSVILQFFTKYFLRLKTIYDVVSGPIGKGIIPFMSKYTIKLGVKLSDKFILDHIGLYNKLKLKTKKVFKIIGIGFDKEIFFEKKGVDLFNKKNDEIIFTYIGALNIERNLDIFIKAFIENIKIYKNIKLYFVGSSYGEEYLKEISRNYINKNIFFLGKKPHNTIPDYINSSDILISYIPKVDYFEYQPPTKLIEYLACNKLVIATDTIAQKEILTGYEYLIHGDSFQDTREKIKYFIENIDTLKNNNYSSLVESYKWSILVQNILKLIKN